MDLPIPSRRRARALLVSVLVAAASLGVGACGSDDPKPAPRPSTPAASIATTPAQVAKTTRGSIGYRSVGSGSPLVLIMGFGSSMEDWEPAFVDELAQTHRVVIFDNAGIGKSKAVASKLTISGMADRTSALIAALKLGKTDVLGWSMGGMIAQALTVRHPGDVRHLVLSATQPGTGKAHEIPKATAKVLASASPAEFLAALYPDDQKAALKAYVDGIARYKHRSTVPGNLYGLQRAAINGWLAGSEPAGKRVTSVTVATLAADGAEDRFNPVFNTRLLAKLFRNSELEIYKDAGHGFLFQPDTNYVTRVNAFLAGAA